MDNARRVDGLTPCFSPLPGVLDLCNGKRIAKVAWDKRYLIGEGQEIVVVTEELNSERVVLVKGITRKASNRSRIHIPCMTSCERGSLA